MSRQLNVERERGGKEGRREREREDSTPLRELTNSGKEVRGQQDAVFEESLQSLQSCNH